MDEVPESPVKISHEHAMVKVSLQVSIVWFSY